MKTMIHSAVLSLFCIAISMVYGGVPAMSVSVSDASGQAAFKGATTSTGIFATGKLKPGNYVVQLNAKSGAVKGNHYAVVVSAGTKKVAASAVPGEKFTGGGVALRVEVGADLNITGQVAESKIAMKNGKKMVWIPPMTGSNTVGRWVEEDSVDAQLSKTRGILSRDAVEKVQQSSTNDNAVYTATGR